MSKWLDEARGNQSTLALNGLQLEVYLQRDGSGEWWVRGLGTTLVKGTAEDVDLVELKGLAVHAAHTWLTETLNTLDKLAKKGRST